VAGFEAGLYRYFPLHGALQAVSPGPLAADLHWSHNRAAAARAPWTVFLVGDLEVLRAQYGRMAEPMAYLEAGMMSQALRSAAPVTGFGVCQIGDVAAHASQDRLHDRLGLSAARPLLTTLIAGKLPAAPAEPALDAQEWQDLLQAHLARHLPPHMLPASTVVLPTLPLTGNGKVDRQALAALPTEGGACGEPTHQPPSGRFEEQAAAVMAQALGVPRVSATANFFDLGANSALLARVHGAIQRDTGTTFPLIHLFRFPTLRSLAAHVRPDAASPPPARAHPPSNPRANRQKAALARLRHTQPSSK
jgi:acyl carrier protein